MWFEQEAPFEHPGTICTPSVRAYGYVLSHVESSRGPDGQQGLFEVYKYFSDFIANIPLNNGHYQDAEATLTDTNLRVTGQKDLVNNRAHIWIQNSNHTWRKVIDKNATTGLKGSVSMTGFAPNTTLNLEWHQFTTQGTPKIITSSATTDASGKLTLNLPTDLSISDAAIKIGDYAPSR